MQMACHEIQVNEESPFSFQHKSSKPDEQQDFEVKKREATLFIIQEAEC